MNSLHAVITALVVVAFGTLGFFLFKKYFSSQPLTLVAGYNTFLKKWTTWLTVIGGAILTNADMFAAWLNTAADSIVNIWAQVPPDFHVLSPEEMKGVGVGILALKLFAALWKQHRLAGEAAPQKDVLPAAKP